MGVQWFYYHLQAKRHRVSMDALSKRYGCSLCDRTYSRKFDMKRHEQYAHRQMENDEALNETEYENEVSSVDDDQTSEDEDIEMSESESEGENTGEPEDNLAYQGWFEQAMTATDELRNEKYTKYISKSMSEEEAKENAHIKVLWAVKRIFFDHYSYFLRHNLYLEEDDINQEILSDIKDRVENGMGVRKAVQRVLARHGTKFDVIFEYQKEDEDDSEEDMEVTEESDN